MKHRIIPTLLMTLAPMAALANSPVIELNKAEQADSACRLTFTAASADSVKSLVLETVLIDTAGEVQLLTLFDFQSLPGGKTRVRQFDLPHTQCAGIGQILFNGIHACRLETGAECAAPIYGSRNGIEVSG